MAYHPKYQITDALLTTITEIESLRSQVAHSRILPEREIELRHRATVEATHSSTAIEGNPLNLKQVEKVLADGTVLTRHQYAEIEVRNYKKALDYIDKRKVSGKPVELADILTIHKLIMEGLLPPEKTGVLRTVGVDIIDQDDTVLYKGPKTAILKEEITALLEWFKESENVHPVIAAAILHFQFVSIHPFSDGNGRTTRVLTQLYLGLRDYDFRGTLVLDSYYYTDRREYYRALRAQGEDYQTATAAVLDPWITYFVNGFLSSAKVLSVEVMILSSVIASNKPVKRINPEDADLLSYAKQFGSISLAEAESMLPNVPRRTLQRKLKTLVDNGYLIVSGSTRSTVYMWANK